MIIKTKDMIHEDALEIFKEEGYLVNQSLDHANALVVRSSTVTQEDLKGVLAVSRAGSGVNNIPVDYCTDNGIVVFNTPGVNSNSVKELVIASLILISRNLIPAIKWATDVSRTSSDLKKDVESGKKAFVGREIRGKTLGIIGGGFIGSSIAKDVVYLGMNVVIYDPYHKDVMLPCTVRFADTLEDLLHKSDYITIHVPCNEETRGMIREETISKMKDEVYLLNFSRGEIVDEDSVINSGKIIGYVTDFPSKKLSMSDKTILMPHIGASTVDSEKRCSEAAAENLVSFLKDGEIVNSVNYPTVVLPPVNGGLVRVVIHTSRDCSLDFEKCSKFLDSLNVSNNVISYFDESKGDVLYTVADLSRGVSQECIDKFINFVSDFDGFRSARVIR